MSFAVDDSETSYGGRLGLGERPALVVIDFVRAYFEPSSPLYSDIDHVIAPGTAVLENCRARGLPIIYTTVVLPPAGGPRSVFEEKIPALSVFAEDAPGGLGEIVSELSPRPGETVLPKQLASAFFGTSLDVILRRLKVDSLILVGLSTSGCIRATAVDAAQHNYRALVIEDAVADVSRSAHAANLFDLERKYADVLSSAELVELLSEKD